ncbi:hypothetical protein CU097_011965 [Rhizopus azygosporus]|uniref:Uncharacterized protein n=2 Tax=Rhizopus TaxID=4842 RepID=A0A367K039_RHIAZ|nr:hypothetical protein BCV71DRAFT_262570 [Rhizopus microsporus]RCH95563.1 hypothetical protein CU097_011965 [Rhizopus azygosporus]
MSAPIRYEYLISKYGDIAFSVTVGTLAYFLNERSDPRTQNGKTLKDLVLRARQRQIQEREAARRS